MYMMVKQRAHRMGIAFDIRPEDIQVPTHCPVLGIALSQPGGGLKEESPTVDRIDPNLGYVRGNVGVLSSRANRLKNDGTAQEHELIAAWMRRMGAK